MSAATIGKAAEDTSAGTSTSIAVNSGWPFRQTSHPLPSEVVPLPIDAPMRLKRRSV